MHEINPFMVDIPIVAIVKIRRQERGKIVESRDEDCKRIWFRVGQSAHRQSIMPDIFPTTGRLYPSQYALHKLREY